MTSLYFEDKLPAQVAPVDLNKTSEINAIAGGSSIAAMFGTLVVGILAG